MKTIDGSKRQFYAYILNDMYILINAEKCSDFKKRISDMINEGEIRTWEFVIEEGKRRLMHKGDDEQYSDVVLRFLNSHDEGGQFIKIRPTIKLGVKDEEKAKSHFGLVLGRFSEVINCHFPEIGTYTTILE